MSGKFALKDRHGNDIHFGHGGEIWLPPYNTIDDYRLHLNNIRHMDLREDDVILAGYPRSGNHWNNQILHMLLKNTTDYVGQPTDDFIDWHPVDKLKRPDARRVILTHLRFQFLPRQLLEKKVKVVYCYRNPKDEWCSYYTTASNVSAFPEYKGTWNHFFDLMMDIGYWYGDWFDHVLHWEKAAKEHPDLIFTSCYEKLKTDTTGQIKKLDEFLGLKRGQSLCEGIADACQFKKLKAGREKVEDMTEVWKDGSTSMYRKGQIGDWKNWFTVAQSELFDSVFKKRMATSRLSFIFQ